MTTSTSEPATAASGAKKLIVVVGASIAGLPITHYLLRHVLPAVKDAHIILVDPNAQGSWFQRIGSPRAIVSEDLLPLDKIFLPIPQAFAEYPQDKLTLLQGRAASLDYKTRTITVVKDDGTTQAINYYALVIATGAASPSPLLGVQTSSSLSTTAIQTFREKLQQAKSIVIAGGGPAGVETAGELGHFLNGQAGWFASRPSNPKTKITLVTTGDRLVPVLREALGKKAEKLLNKVGVDVIYNTKVQSTVPETAGRLDVHGELTTLVAPAEVLLSDGQSLEADLFIPAWGLKPNSSWLPGELLDGTGRVVTNKSTLRVDNAGPRVYAVGDVAAYGRGGAFELMNALPVASANIKRDLLSDATTNAGAHNTTLPSSDKHFEDKIGESQLVPIGKSSGVGAVFGWKLPAFFVWMIKGRDYLSSSYPDTLNGAAFKNDVK